jgi:hypothetical protein
MKQDDKVVEFLNPHEEMRQQRAFRKATRLANLAPGEWKLYVDEEAQALGIPVEKYTEIVLDILSDREKKAKETKTDIRREDVRVERNRIREQRQQEREDKRARQDEARARKEADRIAREEEAKRKKRETAFAEIADLPQLTHQVRLREAAARLGEDFESLAQEFDISPRARFRRDWSRGARRWTPPSCWRWSRPSSAATSSRLMSSFDQHEEAEYA